MTFPQRRRVYLLVTLVGLVGCAWRLSTGRGTEWELRLAYPLLSVYLAFALVVLVALPRRIRAVEVGGYATVTTVWLATMAAQLATIEDDALAWQSLFPGVYANVFLVIVLAQLWFDRRWALWLSLVAPVVSTVIGLARFLPTDAVGRDYTAELLGAQGYLVVLALLIHLMARSKEALARTQAEASRMRELAFADQLTGLPNRRRLTAELDRLLHDRRAQGPIAVIAFDLDRFKAINDTHGHEAGDEVLRAVADLARGAVRGDHVVGRWGGEEFLVLAPHTDLAAASVVAERLRAAIAGHVFPRGLTVTASFGVDVVRPGEEADGALHRADRLLYAAKAAGRDAVVAGEP